MALETSLEATPDADCVRFVLEITNTDDQPSSLTFRDAGKADFVVLDGETECWRWSDGRVYAQVLTTEELAPGETLRLEAVWEQPTPGEYDVICELKTMDGDEIRTTLSV
ncbi:BsuPI-related putative proteinase inhibitor [Haladaptatus sp. DJG-WS-42]|uniref:BsuPI-related putative proteinase inhibitor n=1 Tax=Haladaptatus sp. DJG-WS-42 TaxID=3120516 RepID=UPI0030D23C8D